MSTDRPSTLPPPGSTDVLYVLDLSNFVFRAYHALPPLTAPTGEPTNATLGTLNMFQRILTEQRPVHLAIAMDSKGRGFRGELSPEYKAHRPPAPEDLVVQLRRCRTIFDAHRIPAFQRDGFEADDVIASLVRRARAAGLRVVIASADKDLYQLVEGDEVVVWDAMRGKVYGPREVHEKFGVEPRLVRDLLALVGDTSDNVPGIPGVGPKTAAQLLLRFGSFANVLASASAIDRPKLRQAVTEHVTSAELAYRLVELKDDLPLDVDLATLRFGPPDLDALRAIYGELAFSRLLEGLGRGASGDATPGRVPEPPPVAEPDAPAQVVAAPPRDRSAPKVTTLLDRAALHGVVVEARARGGLALVAFGTDGEPMRSALVGIGLQPRGGSAYYLPLGHRTLTAPRQLPLEDVRATLGPLLADETLPKLGHDAKYTQALLARHGLAVRGVAFDTMLASYLVDPESAHRLDHLAARAPDVVLVDLTLPSTKGSRAAKLGTDELEVEAVAPHVGSVVAAIDALEAPLRAELESAGLTTLLVALELPLADVLAEMELAGVELDPRPLAALGERMTTELAELEVRAYAAAGHPLNLASPRQLETVLFDELGLEATKKTKTGRSTDAEALEAVADAHPLPRLILEHRAIAKLKGTYVDTLPQLLLPQTHRIHTHWEQAVAATGRLSSRDPNMQNIPVRSEHGKRIRAAFVAPPGKCILSADYSQIELRVLAHLSHDPALVEAFSTGQDVHVRTAMAVFGVGEDAVTSEMRAQSKTVNFGVIYGMGAIALAKRLGIPRADAKRFIDAYFEQYRGVDDFMRQTLEAAQECGEVRTLFGRRRLLPDLRSTHPMKRAYAERIAQNTPIQGTAADLLKLAMVKLAQPVLPGVRMVLTVHDELVFEVPEGDVEEAARLVRSAMESVAPLDVPLVVDVGWGASWADAH
ncbi:MAG: DNA polymerase I [Deltaproteobacteria bacterium]|nr:DNA polymerase I [Deltaproteobacteria bacterium]